MAKKVGEKTKYPGVTKLEPKVFRVRGAYRDPRTGKRKEVTKILKGVTARQASKKLAELLETAHVDAVERKRVSDFAKSWIESKSATVTTGTAVRYATALEKHVLPGLGDLFCDELRGHDVQLWVNEKLKGGYSVRSVHGWYRTLRTMMTDAMYQLDLPRDPTARVSFPEAPEPTDVNSITVAELGRLLEAFKLEAPQHYGIVAVLAYTGLRFTHASALKWEDVDYEQAVLHVNRRQFRGEVGPITRKKRAPRRIPLAPELADILKWQRNELVRTQAKGVESGWMFPSTTGGLRASSSVRKSWKICCEIAGIEGRFTPHGLRRTFNDLARRAGVDAIVTKSLTGHVTDRMREHYSTVRLDEKRLAISNVVRLIQGDGEGSEG